MKKNHSIWKGLALLFALVLFAGSLTALADEPADPKVSAEEEQVPSGEDLVQGETSESGADATDEASEPAADPFGNWPVEIDKTDCSITLLLEYLESGETRTLVNGTIALFTVATVKVDNGYVFDVESGKFADVEAVQGIPSMNSEALDDVNATLARSLETLAEGREADKTAAVADGQVTFTGLKPGLYLLIQTELSDGDRKMNPFLLSIPDRNGDYEVTAKPKPGIYVPPETTPEETPPETTPPEEIPETGQEWWPVWFMGGIGVLLVLLGLFTRIKERQ